MRHDAIEFAAASVNAKRRGTHRSRGERLRDASRLTASRRPEVAVIDEAFAGFTRVDAPAEPNDESAVESLSALPARLSDCLSAQLSALDRQRSQLVELLRRVDQESQVV
jgi:hypothetical protein